MVSEASITPELKFTSSAQLWEQGLQGKMKEMIHVSKLTAVYIMQNWKGLRGFILTEVESVPNQGGPRKTGHRHIM